MHKYIHKLILPLIVTLVCQVPIASHADTLSEYTIKAAFIYNFVRFTKWPDNTNEIRICIYGKDPFGNNIDSLNGKKSDGRTISIIRTNSIEEVKSCQLAFLNIIPPERHLFEKAIYKISGHGVLTVSDAANVINYGVMIGLSIENDKVAFAVNHTAAQSSDLVISAKLLRLAREII